jgi:hypothetical protein
MLWFPPAKCLGGTYWSGPWSSRYSSKSSPPRGCTRNRRIRPTASRSRTTRSATATSRYNIRPTGARSEYFYDTQFLVNFADLERWTEAWTGKLRPALQGAVDDGILDGWVEESHNTGGRFNWKVILMIDEWDDIGDLQSRFFSAAPLGDPLWHMFTGGTTRLQFLTVMTKGGVSRLPPFSSQLPVLPGSSRRPGALLGHQPGASWKPQCQPLSGRCHG